MATMVVTVAKVFPRYRWGLWSLSALLHPFGGGLVFTRLVSYEWMVFQLLGGAVAILTLQAGRDSASWLREARVSRARTSPGPE